jgi:signal transduction histidine kinase/DNA-binding response OmpR family regulator
MAANTVVSKGEDRLVYSTLHRIQDTDAVGLGEALELVSQGFILVRPDGRIGFVNECAIRLLELPAWLINGPCRFRDLMTWQMENGEYTAAKVEHREFVRSGAMAARTGKFQYVRPNGTVLEVHYVPLKNREGGSVITMVDVTARDREAAFLAEQKERAERDALAKEQFFAMMSHEMRTPLNGVLGIAEILADTPLTDEQRRHLDVLRESGDDLLRIINAVLDFSKMSSGGAFDLEAAPFDLRRAVGAAAATVRAQAEAKDIELRVDIAETVPVTMVGDAARLKQVLLNLLGNAVKFTDEGRVTVAASSAPASHGKTKVRFEVRDTGIGIPKEARDSLFDAFTQVDASVSRRFGGTGLGLAICRKIVEKMGASIQVESTVGRGSAFSFEIELPVTSETMVDSVVALHIPPIPQKRILLAEDNATNTLVATELLTRMGHEVVAVSNGREAVDAIAAQDFDVVLMDVMMPEMDGLTASRVIKATEKGRSVPIIALTANAQRDRHDATIAAGMEFVVQKPISRHRLEQGLHRLFGISTPEEATVDHAASSAAALPIVDRSAFEEFAAEMGPAAHRMVETFMAETQKSMGELLHESDGLKIVRAAHSLKSSAALFGFAKLSALAAELEEHGSETASEPMINAIAKAFEETCAAARAAA